MKNSSVLSLLTATLVLLSTLLFSVHSLASSAPEVQEVEPEKGPHRGRMLREGDFALELSIFETGVPPEFRVWVSDGGVPIAPEKVRLNIKLTRLGGVVDDIQFKAQSDFLRGDMEIYEPHSFVVTIIANYQGKAYRWEYDNFEGRTTIEDAVAKAMEIETAYAGAATLHQTIPVFGELTLPSGAQRNIAARFDGEIQQLHVRLGDMVKQGQPLLTIESNESLKAYKVNAPLEGVITAVNAGAGEQTQGRVLLTITDTSHYLAKLAVYPMDYSKVAVGSPVAMHVEGVAEALTGKVEYIEPKVRDDQARLVWVKVANKDEGLSESNLNEGSFVSADIEIATIDVPLAVKRTGLQGFRDFTVVYAKVGEEYEVRMLQLGREDSEWVEVLGGLAPGTEYVSENSYIIKADIEKSGAAHDH
ncbi:efflux RND transporter periplasmic adaptor subunit [Paraneptunicella aestuarii]|uniref:efflux RND transporter periplasmic adaptor subunit n=1 Tax=Paraneptunicella aestuarii TaxID=2831148 RepID=UPI001E46989D|nr:HlyD family efflux transporter periplasmic adaptor subunit [Paraneptunicella aestuarii]UAA39068.1 efflux RND transporter periplasmic adaptor subunit [Paraneptunicella aestuarii]